MNTEDLEIRSIVDRSELESVYDMIGHAFLAGRDFFQIRIDQDSSYDMSTTWIAKQHSLITSTIQVFPMISRVGIHPIRIAGLGSVATLPEYQGQGQCRQILHRLTHWMKQEEYDLSLLFAVITPFYEKSGWQVVPEPLYQIDIGSIPADNNNNNIKIISYDSSHTTTISDIYDQFNQSRTYTIVRSSTTWQDLTQWPRWKSGTCLLAVRNNIVVAYGLISETKKDGVVHLDELCYLDGEESSAICLFQALVQQRPDARSISASLPADHALIVPFVQWGATKSTMNYAMWKIIQFQPLLAKLTPTFEKRLNSNHAIDSLQLCMNCVEQQAYIYYDNGKLAIEHEARKESEYANINLSQEEFIAMLLQGYDDTTHKTSHANVLKTLFPTQNSVFYNIDKF
ncbi:GNAT family N-acetyltransferase [Paenibacillus sp. CMAA1364]